jgi:formamidopyrimidine-DNA glycosylase
MPELPEVETVVRQLQTVLPGKTIAQVTLLHPKTFAGDAHILKNKTIEDITRRAKMLVISFVNSKIVLIAHLKMTGQLIFVPKATSKVKRIVGGHPTPDWIKALPSPYTRVSMSFSDGSVLYFNDQRLFGWIRVMTRDWWLTTSDKLPPDVVDPEFTIDYLIKVLSRSTRAVKLVLLDQAKMGGMGNIYANDALWLAKVNPSKPAHTLSKKEIIALHQAMQHVLARGIELGGASESTYKHINGMGGSYQDEFLIYKKEGEQCTRCGAVIEKIKLGGRGTYWCRGCQLQYDVK